MQRIIGLLDMDYFYAQIEERENPSLKNVPVVMCVFSGRSADSGAVATCNYAARKLGIKSGIPIAIAKKIAIKEPKTVFLPVRIDLYKTVSESIMTILKSFCDSIETVGLDEAYFDLSIPSEGDFSTAKKLCAKIKQAILDREKLTCSIGVAPNKLVAKVACDSKKPDGLTVVSSNEVISFLNPLPPKKLLGVGPKTEEKLAEKGINTIEELQKPSLVSLQASFGSAKGKFLFDASRGIDDSPVESDWQKLQLSHIKTLSQDATDFGQVSDFLNSLCVELFERVKKEDASFKSVSILCVSSSLESFSKQKMLAEPAKDVESIQLVSKQLAKQFFEEHPGISLRRIGVRVGTLVRKTVSDSNEKTRQPKLFDF